MTKLTPYENLRVALDFLNVALGNIERLDRRSPVLFMTDKIDLIRLPLTEVKEHLELAVDELGETHACD